MTKPELAELLRRVEADDPSALFEYAEYLRPTDPEGAHKFTVLAAQLGNPTAMERMGDEFYAKGNVAEAVRYFKTGAKAGRLDCLVKLSILSLGSDDNNAISELEELAELGVPSACNALAEYYSRLGNKRQAAYWRSLIR